MNDLLVKLVTLLNAPANWLGAHLFSFIAATPGWLSNTIISAETGVLLLILFKYTSNQKAIGRVRDGIKANMLALKLFKDDLLVTLKSQGEMFAGAFALLFYSVRPMAVMIVPVCLLLAQLGLWYQAQPLPVGEETIVTAHVPAGKLPEITLQPDRAFEIVSGPVRIPAKDEIVWQVKAVTPGRHLLRMQLAERHFDKELVIGEGFKSISIKRPGWNWSDILLNPAEKPFAPDSPIQSISIEYPKRLSHTSGSDWWVIYFFVASMVFAFLFKPILKVRI